MNEHEQIKISSIACYDKEGNKLFECPVTIVELKLPKSEREIKRDYYYKKFVRYANIMNKTKSKRIKKKNLKLCCEAYAVYRKCKLWNYGGMF